MDEVTLSTSSIGNGRYRVTGLLGAGGMAVVYEVFDTMLKVRRAVKVLNSQYSKSQKVRQRFLAEAQTMAQLRHPNIITIYDIGMDDGAPFIVMELAQGGSLQGCLDSIGPYTGPLAARLIQGALRGLQVAHESGVIHRDIKPHNILLTKEGVPKLTDFGVARVMDSDHSLTKTGAVMGTLAYMSPEQRMNAKSASFAVDVYSTGASLYSMIKGSHSFDLYSTEFHERLFEGVGMELRDVIAHACQYEPSERYASAAAMGEALEPISSSVSPEEWSAFLAHLDNVRSKETEVLADDSSAEQSLETYALDYGFNEAEGALSPNTGSTVVEAKTNDTLDDKKSLTKAFVVLVLLFGTAVAVSLINGGGVASLNELQPIPNETLAPSIDRIEVQEDASMVPVVELEAESATGVESEEVNVELATLELPEPEVLDQAQANPVGADSVIEVAQSAEEEVEQESVDVEIDVQGGDSGVIDNTEQEDLITLSARIYTIPPTELSIDGEDVGSTPWSGDLAPGEYSLVMTTRDGQVQETDISVAGDEEYSLCWSFESEGPCRGPMRERDSRSRWRRGR